MVPDTESRPLIETSPQELIGVRPSKHKAKDHSFKVLWSDDDTSAISSDFPLIGLGVPSPKAKLHKVKSGR